MYKYSTIHRNHQAISLNKGLTFGKMTKSSNVKIKAIGGAYFPNKQGPNIIQIEGKKSVL